MNKRLVTLLLTLVLLVCGAAALGEQTPGLEPARISELQSLAGEDSALWREGTAPCKSGPGKTARSGAKARRPRRI